MSGSDMQLSRRQVLVAGSASLAGLAVSRPGIASAGPANVADVLVVGHGLAGLVAAAELADAGRKVVIVDQEPEQSLGGQAFWSLGGLFFINSPEQILLGVSDSLDRARKDWFTTAGFDRSPTDPLGEDFWGRRWAEAYLQFAAGEKRDWLNAMGVGFVPVVGWAERGGDRPGPGNSVPRFHLTIGTGPGVVEPFERRVRDAVKRGLISFRFRHRVDDLIVTGGAVTGIRGAVLEPSDAARGTPSSRLQVGGFELYAPIVLVTSGGIGGNQALVRENWPVRLGAPPKRMITGVPAHVDGRMIAITERAGGRVVNRDRMWHYTEGLQNYASIWPQHGIRVLSAPSPMWFDAKGQRFPDPGIPSSDTLSTLELIQKTGYDYSWFVLNKRIIKKEFTLSGSEQNPELTRKDLVGYIADRLIEDVPAPVQAFLDRGADFVTATTVSDLATKMNALVGSRLIDAAVFERQIVARDKEAANPNSTDPQIRVIRKSLSYAGDNLLRTTPLHPILEPAAGPLIAIRMNILIRKTLGGLQTDLSGRVMNAQGRPVPGLMAAGEVTGFGGGGVHGYRALEGTFLGGCLFSGRTAGRAAAKTV